MGERKGRKIFLPRDDIDKFDVDTVCNVWGVFDYTLVTGGDVGPPRFISKGLRLGNGWHSHADIVEADGTIEVETTASRVR